MANLESRRIVLAERPKGAPTPSTFRLERAPVPTLDEGQVLLRTVYLSLDPYMRGRMSEGPSYAQPTQLGDVLPGGTVSKVEASRHPSLQPGQLVLGYVGWQEYALSDGSGLSVVDDSFLKPSYALGVLGMPGMTAYVGLLDIGEPKPGETVVVAAATGAVGSVVGQLAKLKGARAVGIAGGPEKCAFAVQELGFEACLDHRAPELAARLKQTCDKGVDVYFENVGGAVFEAVAPLLNAHGRVPICGFISRYNAQSLPPGPDRSALLLAGMLIRRLRMQGFIVGEHEDRREAFLRDMKQWVRAGRIKTREDIVQGIESAPSAFIGLLDGKNFGKLLVQVGEI